MIGLNHRGVSILPATNSVALPTSMYHAIYTI